MTERINDLSIEKFRRMARIRGFEAVAEAIHAAGEVSRARQTYTRKEANGVDACMALRPDDYMVGTRRSNAHPIAKGAALTPWVTRLPHHSMERC